MVPFLIDNFFWLFVRLIRNYWRRSVASLRILYLDLAHITSRLAVNFDLSQTHENQRYIEEEEEEEAWNSKVEEEEEIT